MKLIRREISRALDNEQGASLMIAIVILLIAAVLAGIVISAASVNMHRINRNYEEQQAFLTAESTALMFEKLIQDSILSIIYNADDELEITCISGGDFGGMLKTDVYAWMNPDPSNPVTEKNRSLKLTDESGVEEVLAQQSVDIAYEMNAGYGIEIMIEVIRDGTVISRMYAEFPASLSTQGDVTTLSWNKGFITRLETRGEDG